MALGDKFINFLTISKKHSFYTTKELNICTNLMHFLWHLSLSLQQIHSPKMSFVQNDMLSHFLQHSTILYFKISRWNFSEPHMSFKCLISTQSWWEWDIQLSFMPLNIFFFCSCWLNLLYIYKEVPGTSCNFPRK